MTTRFSRRRFAQLAIGAGVSLLVPEFTRSVWALDRTHLKPGNATVETNMELDAFFNVFGGDDRWIMISTLDAVGQSHFYPTPLIMSHVYTKAAISDTKKWEEEISDPTPERPYYRLVDASGRKVELGLEGL